MIGRRATLCKAARVVKRDVSVSFSRFIILRFIGPLMVTFYSPRMVAKHKELECGPMHNVMVALPNIGGALCSTPQSLADAHYLIAVQ